jgi:Lecithin:cholesterol acyltransferase
MPLRGQTAEGGLDLRVLRIRKRSRRSVSGLDILLLSLIFYDIIFNIIHIFSANTMPTQNKFLARFIFGVALVFCLSLFWSASTKAALYSTYADVSNTSTVGAMPTWEILQIYKMPIRGRINSIQIKANGVDGGGTSMLRPGVCRVASNTVGVACASPYVWANENPYISRGLKWYTYTFPDTLFDKGAYVKMYFDKNGRVLYWQEYAVKAPSSTYADGLTWITGSSYPPEQGFDMQVLLDITPCNDVFSGRVYNTSTNEAVGGAKVRMILGGFVATDESCANFLAAYSARGDAYCIPGDSAGLVLTTDSAGFFNFLAPEEIGSNYTVQTTAENFATATVPYSEIYTNNGGCYNPISHDFYLEPVVKRTPIVIVPGILGSYLYDGTGEEVWPNIPKMLLPGDDSYLDKLMLRSDGISGASDVYYGDIMRKVWGQDYFESLITELKNSGYIEGKDLFVFPYDWRLDIAVSSNLLKHKINKIKEQTGMGKVDIIAHSMGGLVAKKYIEDYGQNSVDKFIDIATPHLGAPKAAKILMFGDNLDIRLIDTTVVDTAILNPLEIQKIAQNMPAIYQLLPSMQYFGDGGSYISDIYDADQNGVQGNLNFGQSMEFIKNSGRNEYLLTKNDELHSQIDNFDPTVYGIDAYNIVGCGQPTIGKIYVLNKEINGYEYGLKYVSGDGTVPLKSAEGMIGFEDEIYATGGEHSKLPSFAGVKELVTAIAQDKENIFNFASYLNLHQDNSACALNGYVVSFHSPIELHVYDENNNHLGPDANGDFEIGIAGASYDIIDGNKFAFLPKNHSYRIVGRATGSGAFNARVQDIQNNEVVQTQYFNSVPLESPSTTVEYALSDETQNIAMNLDEDGDQTFENIIVPSAILGQNESADVTKPRTSAIIAGTLGQNNWYTSDGRLSLSSDDGESGSGIWKIEYSMDYGVTWQEYSAPIVMSSDGRYNIQYKATDRAGNVENIQEVSANIDKTSPAINLFAPLNGDDYTRAEELSPVYDVNDVSSGVATDTIKISLDGVEINTSTIKLFDYSLASHTLAITAQDLAGNPAIASIDFSIYSDIDGAITDVGILYGHGDLNDKANKQLLNDLNLIKKQIQQFGQRKIRIDKRLSESMDKCLVKKKVDWCNKKIKFRQDKFEYTLNKIYEKIISLQYQLIITEVNQYQKKIWITNYTAAILKEDINYLIKELK